VADLGCWDQHLARALADVDLLALEFNHDVALEYASGRQARLIARVLGDEGHLSNVQAAALLREVLRLSAPGRLRHVVQLHLSQECNRPHLAAAAARAVLAELSHAPELHTAHQDCPGPALHLEGGISASPRSGTRPNSGSARNSDEFRYRSRPSRPHPQSPFVQRWLPGMEESSSGS
jgi:hypothetical protein